MRFLLAAETPGFSERPTLLPWGISQTSSPCQTAKLEFHRGNSPAGGNSLFLGLHLPVAPRQHSWARQCRTRCPGPGQGEAGVSGMPDAGKSSLLGPQAQAGFSLASPSPGLAQPLLQDGVLLLLPLLPCLPFNFFPLLTSRTSCLLSCV